uniref:Uncharacterized protein n=1 Tax=Arion vulgaris TaxID=1028688 RepID=A0A0B6ZB20_9EUPU
MVNLRLLIFSKNLSKNGISEGHRGFSLFLRNFFNRYLFYMIFNEIAQSQTLFDFTKGVQQHRKTTFDFV